MKPLNKKNYGSIPHLLGSKLGESDHHIHEGQHKILTEKTRDRHDFIIVQEKYDGSNVGITKVNGKIHAITRSGYLAETSKYIQHIYFKNWVRQHEKMFYSILKDSERICGEWMLQAHSLKYNIVNPNNPFIVFDYFTADNERISYVNMIERLSGYNLLFPRVLCVGYSAFKIEDALNELFDETLRDRQVIAATDKPEGMVYRLERKGKVDFLAKFVRDDYKAGQYLGEGIDNVWNCDITKYK